MASEKFLKAQFGLQTLFGTPVAVTHQFPAQGDYEDAHDEHVAEHDAGVWTPQTIVEQTSEFAKFTLKGAGFFELLPVLFNAAFGLLTPTGTDPWIYADEVDPAAVGTPSPYTWLFGGGENLGATGPAVKIPNAYCESITLQGNLNSKQVSCESAWFGTKVDDNSGAGFAFGAVNHPPNLAMLKILLETINLQDAAATGGDFTTMTALTGKLLDWTLKIVSGAKPAWSSDQNALTFGGVRFEQPSIEFTPTIRTDATTYGLVKAKQRAKTFQELQFSLSGALTRAAVFQITGRWAACPKAHERGDGEIVMKPTFRAETPWTQVTTPHWFDYSFSTKWQHPTA